MKPLTTASLLSALADASLAFGSGPTANSSLLEQTYISVATLQGEFFERHRGTWPRAIDWTAAFIHTSLSATTNSLSKALGESHARDVETGMVWNMVDTYFSQIVGFYFGQDYRAIKHQNAITNELWIAASAKMYLDYPGDGIAGTWSEENHHAGRNRTFLEAAMKGYEWLMNVNMTNDAGLFVDGFHISNQDKNNTKCDVRDEMVFTYNQGVLLTGQRALWEATGGVAFLKDGHHLIQSVIKATGWDLKQGGPVDKVSRGKLPHGVV
ncbi:unnamed protein product [Parascedosporium putredinis]|uniref:Uncharacterized protein n=1 Tax=Parascedosporium putredinis TaxID=1442378 RepID=A0A9P1H9V8_9PEZI|nr:unnamed protein product [Parascedosporium putredinis]CAI8002217.1 unnamed protein product [Parascedosporium putredinis]